jgi:hypothetical protein
MNGKVGILDSKSSKNSVQTIAGKAQ